MTEQTAPIPAQNYKLLVCVETRCRSMELWVKAHLSQQKASW